MPNTASVYARIDPALKSDVEEILKSLGLTPSTVVQMLYSQIKLTRGIPFEIKLPAQKPLSLAELTRDELDRELKKADDSLKSGKYYTADEVDRIVGREFGIK